MQIGYIPVIDLGSIHIKKGGVYIMAKFENIEGNRERIATLGPLEMSRYNCSFYKRSNFYCIFKCSKNRSDRTSAFLPTTTQPFYQFLSRVTLQYRHCAQAAGDYHRSLRQLSDQGNFHKNVNDDRLHIYRYLGMPGEVVALVYSKIVQTLVLEGVWKTIFD